MQSITVSIEDIKKGNPRLCLSALRFTGHCYQCPCYANKKTGKTCESRIITEEGIKAEELQAKRKKLKTELKDITEQLKRS